MSNKRAILINFLNRIEFGFKLKLAGAVEYHDAIFLVNLFNTIFSRILGKTLTFTETFQINKSWIPTIQKFWNHLFIRLQMI